MSDTVSDSTSAVPEEVWRQYLTWAGTARRGKTIQDRARTMAFALGVTGAVLGVVSGYFSPTWARVWGIAAGVAVALAGFIGREFFLSQGEPDWSRARILAEALKRETWLYLMKIPRYDGEDRDENLQKVARELQGNVGLRRSALPNGSSRPLPNVGSLTDYLRQRIDDQIAFYEKAWTSAAATLQFWRPITLSLGAAALIRGLDLFKEGKFPTWIPVVTTVAAAIAAHLRALRLEALLSLYQAAEGQLRLKRAAATAKAPADAAAFVRDCEEIMSRENQSWRAEWRTQPQTEEGSHARKD